MKVGLSHRTLYRYDRPVRLGPQSVRLRPTQGARTPIVSYDLHVDPAPSSLRWQQDARGNLLARLVVPGAVTSLEVIVELVADMTPIDPFDFLLEPSAESWPFAYDPLDAEDLAANRRADHAGPHVAAICAGVPPTPQPTVQMVLDLTAQVRDRVAYIVRMEPGVWDADRTLAEGQGSCRDSAWVLVQVLRGLGYAARFVSGYLIELDPQGAELHAWAEVFLPGAGWLGLDATSGLVCSEGHIPLAASPRPMQAAPMTGTVEPSGVELVTDMRVTRPA